MTHFWTRFAMIGLGAGALAACATPQYPTAEGQTPRAPMTMPQANFPITQAEPAAPVETAPAIESQTLATPPSAVSSAPLAPIVQAPPPEPITRTVTVAGGKVVDAEGKPQTYEVQSGEGLDAIARKLGTTRTQLAEANDLKAPYNLRPGQTLTGPTSKTKAYVVESGDTLYAIARRFTVPAPSIAATNDFEMSAPIRPGQKLLLPAGFRDVGPSTRTVTITPPPVQQAMVAPAPVVQTPVAAPTLVAQQTVAPPVVQAPAPKPYTPPVMKPYVAPAVVPPPPPPPVAKPYTPPPAAVVARPYTPPATAPKPYTPSGTPIIQTNAPPTDNEVTSAGQGRFLWPVKGEVLSGFGPKGGGQRNDGLNIRALPGAEVRAAAGGEVVYSGNQVPGFGNLVLVKHADGWVTAYAHLSRLDVKMRDTVGQGQQIGQVGATGGVAEPQLHFEVRYAPSPKDKARPVDPLLVLPR
jgi:murein DD-endopeptidase MepM/ murein hydrolase activator NlpD